MVEKVGRPKRHFESVPEFVPVDGKDARFAINGPNSGRKLFASPTEFVKDFAPYLWISF